MAISSLLPPPAAVTFATSNTETASNTDSGIDDRALPPSLLSSLPPHPSVHHHHHHPGAATAAAASFETGSIISNMSSEDGSDIGVSMSFDPKMSSDVGKMASVTSWSVSDVGRWLSALGLDSHREQFATNHIDGSHLPHLGKHELVELGVASMGHRMTIKNALKKLQP